MKINKEFITLSQLLKMEDYVSSGGMVKHVIHDFDIKVNGEDEYRRGKKIYPGDIVFINGNKIVIEQE